MQFLVASGEEIITEPRTKYFLDWIDPPDPPDTPAEPRRPERPDVPELPPIIDFTNPIDTDLNGVGVPAAPPEPQTYRPTFARFGVSDGPLINIIKVQPTYPAAAAARGLDGTVVVQFDVTAMGVVENVVVVESTNKKFNKAAIEAAFRFKYKPRVVDGIPYGAKGLRQLFRFEMEK